MNRRNFLLVSAAGFLPVMPARRSSDAAAAGNDAGTPVAAAVFDARYAGARAFADRLRRQGVATFPTQGDAAGQWYGDLGRLLRQTAGRVAGLTTHPDLVIARSCGRELSLQIVFERREPGQHLTVWLLEPRTNGRIPAG